MADINPVTLIGGTVFAILGGILLGRKKRRVVQQPMNPTVNQVGEGVMFKGKMYSTLQQAMSQALGTKSDGGYWLRGTEYVDDKLIYKDGSSRPYLVRKRDGFLVPQPRTQKELLNEYGDGDWIRRGS